MTRPRKHAQVEPEPSWDEVPTQIDDEAGYAFNGGDECENDDDDDDDDDDGDDESRHPSAVLFPLRTPLALLPGQPFVDGATLGDLGIATKFLKCYGLVSDDGPPRYWLFALVIGLTSGIVAAACFSIAALRQKWNVPQFPLPIYYNSANTFFSIVGYFFFIALRGTNAPLHSLVDPTAWRKRALSRLRPDDPSSSPELDEHRTGLLACCCVSSLVNGRIPLTEVVALVDAAQARKLYNSLFVSLAVVIASSIVISNGATDLAQHADANTSHVQIGVISLIRSVSEVTTLAPVAAICLCFVISPLVMVARIRALVAEIRGRTPHEHVRAIEPLTYEVGAVYELVDLMNSKFSTFFGVGIFATFVAILAHLANMLLFPEKRIASTLAICTLLGVTITLLCPFAVLTGQLHAVHDAVTVTRAAIVAAAKTMPAERYSELVRAFEALLLITQAYRGGSKAGGVVITFGLLKGVVVASLSAVSAIYTFKQ